MPIGIIFWEKLLLIFRYSAKINLENRRVKKMKKNTEDTDIFTIGGGGIVTNKIPRRKQQ